MKILQTCLALFLFSLVNAQTVDFEEFQLPESSFLNDADNGQFQSQDFAFENTYDSSYDFWTGWAISNMTDTITPGWTNQYSCMAGEGVNNSEHFGITYGIPDSDFFTIDEFGTVLLNQMSVCNSTYAYYSLLEGDSFAKKFGGESGNDPDYFSMHLFAYDLSGELKDSATFYLADYRFDDNSQDYIIKDWTVFPIGIVGHTFTLEFRSSDVGAGGINTPTYACIDDINYSPPNAVFNTSIASLSCYPNPTTDQINIDPKGKTIEWIEISDNTGKTILIEHINANQVKQIDTRDLEDGMYFLRSNLGASSFIKI